MILKPSRDIQNPTELGNLRKLYSLNHETGILYVVIHSLHVTRYNLFGSLIGLGCGNPVEAFVNSSQVGFHLYHLLLTLDAVI